LECGASAIKLLVYYNPSGNAQLNQLKRDLVAQVGAECARHDVPFFLEPVGYDPASDQRSFDYARRKPDIAKAIVREFSKPEYSVDVLKVEVPVSMDFVEGATAFRGVAAYGREEAKQHYRDAAALTSKPFVYLSAGASNDQFREALDLASESGARFSGILCGRAVWQAGIAYYAKHETRGLLDWLRAEGIRNIQALTSSLSHAAPLQQLIGSFNAPSPG
jgi:tagatose 1,6-diphosphate aldolase